MAGAPAPAPVLRRTALFDSPCVFIPIFTEGGVEVICSKLSHATSRALHAVRGVVSKVVHQLGVKVHSKIEGEKHLLAAAWECDKSLVNFAPYGKDDFILYPNRPVTRFLRQAEVAFLLFVSGSQISAGMQKSCYMGDHTIDLFKCQTAIVLTL